MYFEGCSSDIYQKNTSIIFDSSKIPSAGLCQELCSDQLELNGIFWFALQVLTYGHHFFNSTINDTFARTLILIIFYQQQVVMWTTYIIFLMCFRRMNASALMTILRIRNALFITANTTVSKTYTKKATTLTAVDILASAFSYQVNMPYFKPIETY